MNEILEFLDFRNIPVFYITLITLLCCVSYERFIYSSNWKNLFSIEKEINNLQKENVAMESRVISKVPTYKYRQSLLDYFKYCKSTILSFNVITVDRDKLLVDYSTIPATDQIYEIINDDFVACVIGDGETTLYDLYIDSLQYVADEIRQDCSNYLNGHIEFLKKKRKNDELCISESAMKYSKFSNIHIVTDDNLTGKVLKKGTPIFVLTDSGMEHIVADGLHTEKYLVNKFVRKVSNKRKCKLRFPKRIK